MQSKASFIQGEHINMQTSPNKITAVNIKYWFYLFILLTALGVILFFYFFSVNDYYIVQNTPDDITPAFYGNNITLRQYNKKTGFLSERLQATNIKHIFSSKEVQLTQPELWQYAENGTVSLHAVADHGVISSDQTTFNFYGHVVLNRSATTSHGEIHVKTEKMTIHTNKNNSKKQTNRS